VLLVDAGDSLSGDRDPALATLGRTSVTAMNMMGYDAMALGPKDLSLGLHVLRQRIDEAEFAMLSANAVVSATGELVAVPYILQQREDHTIALIGLSGGSGTQEIVVRDPLDTVQAVISEAATQSDIIILLSHAGTPTDQKIAEAVPDIDLIISGGKFRLATPWQSDTTGTLILHADASSPGHAGRRLGIATLLFDAEGRLANQHWKRLDLRPEIASDPDMTSWIQLQRRP
jgi:2',3'-cyclic-nucleotide 2'-phosphodiesterase (5'-nucleotidase family)